MDAISTMVKLFESLTKGDLATKLDNLDDVHSQSVVLKYDTGLQIITFNPLFASRSR